MAKSKAPAPFSPSEVEGGARRERVGSQCAISANPPRGAEGGSLVLSAILAVALAGCRPNDEATCELLVARCPMPENRASCLTVIRGVGAAEARKRRDCLAQSRTCPEAAVCLQPGLATGWTAYPPLTNGK